MEIEITSTRKNGEWTATATLNDQFAGSCTTKSKAYAEAEARRGAERQRAATCVGVGSMLTTLSELPTAARGLSPYPFQQFDNVSPLAVASQAGASKAA